MLEEETELWIESVWESMSDELRKKVVIAVDTGLMDAEEPNHVPEAIVRGLSGEMLDEAHDLSFENGVFKRLSLGRHDDRKGTEQEQVSFLLKEALRDYVLVRILL